MSSSYKRKYGLDWPVNYPDAYIELLCWKKWKEYPYNQGNLKDPWDCFFRATTTLFTPAQFTISPWSEQHVYDWTTEDFCITWGCASSSKSNDYGLMTLLDWMVDPSDTVSIMASTTKAMLKIRSFESVVRYFKMLQASKVWGVPGKLSKTMTAIVNDDEQDELATEKASIRGVAVEEGSENEARANLQGAHLPYVRLILDELAQMKNAVMEVRTNLTIGAKSFKLMGLANIDSFYDLAGRYSKPKAGWATVGPNVGEWRTQWGKVRRHDGLLSPAITELDGEKKYPYLLNQVKLDEVIAGEDGNWDAPQIWTMIRAWPPREGKLPTVLTETEIAAWGMQENVTWENEPQVVAGLDPAFSPGGSACILQIAEVGFDKDGKLIIAYGDTCRLRIEASSPIPVIYQISAQIAELAVRYGFSPKELAVDDTGTQSVADVLEREWGPGVLRVSFNGKPQVRADTELTKETEDKRYKDMVTALWYAVRKFGQKGQVRQFPAVAANEYSKRKLKKLKPLQLESKEEFFKSTQLSPDVGDACALVMAVVRDRLRINPGSDKIRPYGDVAQGFRRQVRQKFDLDARNTYAVEV